MVPNMAGTIDSKRESSHSNGINGLSGEGTGAVAVEDKEDRKGRDEDGGVMRAVGR